MARSFNDFLGSKPAYYAQDVLKRVGVTGPPVDLDAIADFRGYEIREISAADHPQFPNLRSILATASAHLLRSFNLILINRDMPLVRRRSDRSHELGHDIMPWQAGLDFSCGESALNSPMQLVEREAFSAGAELLLPRPSFTDDAEATRLAIPSIHGLSRRYQAPLEVTAMRYAALSLRRCAILVAEPPTAGHLYGSYHGSPAGQGQLEFPFRIQRRPLAAAPLPPLAVKYFLKSVRFPHFIFPHTPIAEDTVIFRSWRSGLSVPDDIPAVALGVNNRHVSYRAECHPFGFNGTSKVLVLLSVEDHQLALRLSMGGAS